MDTARMKRTVTTIALCIVMIGCSDTKPPPATSFANGVCAAVSTWGTGIVDAANTFTDESPHLSVDGRRARYLFAFDEQRRITETLREEIAAAPQPGTANAGEVRDALLAAVDDVLANIEDQRADAAREVDFDFVGPRPDRLFSGTEKSLSLMLKPLDEQARVQGVAELGGSCGRD
jgi:hypothetical protein